MASLAPELEERVLVLMPSARDTERAVHLLTEAGLIAIPCGSVPELSQELRRGAAAVLLTDELLALDTEKNIESALREQPNWSALPALVIARDGTSEQAQFGKLGGYSGVILVERPARPRPLVGALRSALRARQSQYKIRDAMAERDRQAQELAAQDTKLRAALTELAAQTEQLQTASRLKDEFLATLAHELRNPLAPISTGLSLLLQAHDPAQARPTLSVMQRQVRHMVRLIDDLLDVSRITLGKLELKRERVAVSSVVESAIEAAWPAIQRAGHAFSSTLSHEALFLDGDQTRLAQVLSNLLNNAAKYTSNRGQIWLSVAREEKYVLISVRDNGVGIPANALQEVFGMFNQVNRQLDRSQGGLGIGLALVKRLVEMHGGTVQAQSPGLNQGSTFVVRLPLASAAFKPPARRSAVSGTHPKAQRILVVDDNDDAADLLSLMLRNAGFETKTVYDGPAAIEAARTFRPNIAILDIGLPGMTGYELAERLRADDRLRETALIALTGWGTPDDRKKAMAAGFDVHLTKPVSIEDLHVALAKAATHRHQQAALAG
ncbi:MAG: hybrid sensor histidine kinase/response regulator [Pseudomonadota bacterium]